MADSSSFVKREVAMTAAFVTWLLLQVGAYLVGHTHLVSSTEWNALAQFLEPILTAGLLTVVGLVVRNFVTPVWTSVGGAVESQGGSFPDEPDLDARQRDCTRRHEVALTQTAWPADFLRSGRTPLSAGQASVILQVPSDLRPSPS
jgi:hypothetical protein